MGTESIDQISYQIEMMTKKPVEGGCAFFQHHATPRHATQNTHHTHTPRGIKKYLQGTSKQQVGTLSTQVLSTHVLPIQYKMR